MRPFDLVLFKGTDFVSNTIVDVQFGALPSRDDHEGLWSHVGILVDTSIMPIKNGIPGKLYIWESILSGMLSDGVEDVETGTWFFGTQIRDFDKVLAANVEKGGAVAYASLLTNPIDQLPDEESHVFHYRLTTLTNLIRSLYSQYNHVHFNLNLIELFSSVFNSLRFFRCFRNSTLFCSEFAALIYKNIGVLPSDLDILSLSPMELIDPNLFPANTFMTKSLCAAPAFGRPVLLVANFLRVA